MTAVPTTPLLLICAAVLRATALHAGEPPMLTQYHLTVAPGSPDPATRIAEIMATRIAARCPATRTPTATYVVTLAIDGSLAKEAYRVEDTPTGVRISGADAAGLLAGAGRFLRDATYSPAGFVPGAWRGLSRPACSFRAAYLATHYGNWYESAPLEDVCTYVEDLGLWGYNTIIVHFPTWQFRDLKDPKAKAWLDRVRTLFARARACGLRVGLNQVPNQGYSSTPKDWRGAKVKGEAQGNFGINCCVSKPEAAAGMLKLYRDLFAEFAEVGCDELVLWPYDEGGCHCPQCLPWGGKGFLEIGKPIVAEARKRFPAIKVTLSTWRFCNDRNEDPDGEWPAFRASMTADPSWVDRIMADGYRGFFPRAILDGGVPARLPLVNFPEISMFKGGPWGAQGAIPAPAMFHGQWKLLGPKLSGGMVYSEGIFEDLNKVLWAGWWWQADAKPDDLVRAYAAWEYGPAVADDVVAALALIDKGPDRKTGVVPVLVLDEKLAGIDARLDPEQA